MTDQLTELIKKLQKENPQFLEGLENAAASGIKRDKQALYDLIIKKDKKEEYEKFYDELDKILSRHENQRLDINWTVGEFIYRIVVSKRKKEPEKPKRERKPKNVSKDSNTTGNDESQAEGANA